MATTTPLPAPGAAAEGPEQTKAAALRRGGLVHGILTNKKALFGFAVLVAFAVLALAAPLIFPGNPSDFGTDLSDTPSAAHLLGTTTKGQDVLALTLWGARSSLAVGFLVGLTATFVACLIGLASAYFGKVVDEILSLLTNIFLLIPGLPLLVVLAAFLPPGPATVVIVLTITGWAGSARVLRSQALSLRGKDFIAAAIVSGEKHWRIMFREILPNMASVAMSTLLGCVIYGIGAQAGLEFLGLGDTSSVSWGTNLYWANNDGALMTGDWWVLLPSGVAIALVAFALAMVNYAVDEITNPRLRTDNKGR